MAGNKKKVNVKVQYTELIGMEYKEFVRWLAENLMRQSYSKNVVVEEKRYYSINAIHKMWMLWISHCDDEASWDDAYDFLVEMLKELEDKGYYTESWVSDEFRLISEELSPEEW